MNLPQKLAIISYILCSNKASSLAPIITPSTPSYPSTTTPGSNADFFFLTTSHNDDIVNRVLHAAAPCQQQQPRQPLLSEESVSTSSFNIELSTESNYADACAPNVGAYASIRDKLDHTFHSRYSVERQAIQDAILDSLFEAQANHNKNNLNKRPQQPSSSSSSDQSHHSQNHQWVTFTAGVMGVGKTHTLKRLHEHGLFPLHDFVRIDPDEIRAQLPEYTLYQQHDPETSCLKTQKEAGLLAEIATHAALERGWHVLVDGSLRDADWYQQHFDSLRQRYPRLHLGIIYITAPLPAIVQRVWNRALAQGGRVVPWPVLKQALQQVPKSIHRLQHLVDYFIELHNSDDQGLRIATPDATWTDFARNWFPGRTTRTRETATTTTTRIHTRSPPRQAPARQTRPTTQGLVPAIVC